MKFYPAVLSTFLSIANTKRNLRLIFRFVAVLVLIVFLYSILFHFLMALEGQDHSWLTGFYWTLTVMTTLG
ncbi:MAG TPA: potassium channel protein, partial [Syntrophales bacterium]|nr:potassium channel protein [Syntrophales bacterium]